jgi:DNA-binding IclR family transcriptional regulator
MRTSDFQDRAIATSLLKALDLMTLLARRKEGMTIPALMGRLKQPRTSILRMLHTLEMYGLAVHDGGVWRSTERFYEWCSRDMYNELKARYHECIRKIAVEVQELVELGVGEGEGVRFIDWVQADHTVTINPLKSSLYPLHRTATGKLLLSQRPDLRERVKEKRLLSEIEEARVKGVAWNCRESDPNVMAVATWAGPASTVTPVICVKWPFFRYNNAKAMRALSAIRRAVAEL